MKYISIFIEFLIINIVISFFILECNKFKLFFNFKYLIRLVIKIVLVNKNERCILRGKFLFYCGFLGR